jgi:hypothetical protein
MDINNVIDTVLNFQFWISTHTGLKGWQLLLIALSVLFLLMIFLAYLRKTRSKRTYLIQSTDRSDIIGINLSGKANNYHLQQQSIEKPSIFSSEEDEEQKSWGQTTKDWRQLREKIRQLEHDIHKSERSEKELKEQLTGLKNTNEKLKAELSKRVKNEESLIEQIKKMTTGTFNQKRNESDDKMLYSEKELEVQKNIKPVKSQEHTLRQEEQTEDQQSLTQNRSSQEKDEQITFIEQIEEESTDSMQINLDSNPLKSNPPAESPKSDIYNQSDIPETEHGIPLDIKELKAIADLAKRLQARGQQRQN